MKYMQFFKDSLIFVVSFMLIVSIIVGIYDIIINYDVNYPRYTYVSFFVLIIYISNLSLILWLSISNIKHQINKKRMMEIIDGLEAVKIMNEGKIGELRKKIERKR